MFLWGRNWTRDEILSHTGSLNQIGGITHFEYASGKGKGVTCLRVATGTGLVFDVVPDRGLDIIGASFRSKSLCWHSPNGIVHPAYYDARDVQWLKSFSGGLVTTCGLLAAGAPSEDNGQQLGLHGAYSSIPADHVAWNEEWQGDEVVLTIKGAVRESGVFLSNLLLTRTYTTRLGSNKVSIRDVVENQGIAESPHMQLYHINLGFPFLNADSRIYARSLKVEPRDAVSQPTVATWDRFEPPQAGIAERVYYHQLATDSQGWAKVVVVSEDQKRNFAFAISYDKSTLPELVQWKMTGYNHYVLGIEPANCRVGGRKSERERGALKTLKPGEKRSLALDLEVIVGEEEVTQALAAVK